MKIRQAYPLLLAHADDDFPIKGRTRFQKMIFLFQIEMSEKYPNRGLDYGYIPYHYGPYSSKLQEDIDELIADEYLQQKAHQDPFGNYFYEYKLTSKGEKLAEDLLTEDKYADHRFMSAYRILKKVKNDANYTDLNKLLKNIYQKHPDYAKFSVYEF